MKSEPFFQTLAEIRSHLEAGVGVGVEPEDNEVNIDGATLEFLSNVRQTLAEREDDTVKKAAQVADMGDYLKKLGLHVSFGKGVTIAGETFKARDTLKKYGFSWDKGSKAWKTKTMNLDFHALYKDLSGALGG